MAERSKQKVLPGYYHGVWRNGHVCILRLKNDTQGSNCGGEGRYARPRGGESGFSGACCQSLRSSSQTEPECGESAGTVPTAAQEVKYT